MKNYLYIILFLSHLIGFSKELKVDNYKIWTTKINYQFLNIRKININDSIPFLSKIYKKSINNILNTDSNYHFFDINFGHSSSDFKYTNSLGNNNLEFIPGNATFFNFNYSFTVFKGFFIRSGIDFMKFNTSSQDYLNGNSYQWNSNYLGIGSGFYWRLITVKNFTIAAQSKIGIADMISGTQFTNLSTGSLLVNSLNDNNDFKSDLYYSMGISINYQLSESLIIGLNVSKLVNSNNGISVPNNWDNESLRQNAINYGLTIMFPIN